MKPFHSTKVRHSCEHVFGGRHSSLDYDVNKNNKTIDTIPMISHICADKVREIDANFSEEKMLSWARILFIKFQI